MGLTMTSILRDQFVRLRDGDSYFYTNDKYLDRNDIERIKETKLSDIINLNTNINTNINTQTNALVNQSRDEEFRRMRDAGIFQGATMSATTPDKAQIDYFYDFDTIFANPQQAQCFAIPY